jgi:hypothetical protein
MSGGAGAGFKTFHHCAVTGSVYDDTYLQLNRHHEIPPSRMRAGEALRTLHVSATS